VGAQYTGGLDRVSENEGKLALLWQNEVAQERSSAASCKWHCSLLHMRG
jgi:hypothetical protein